MGGGLRPPALVFCPTPLVVSSSAAAAAGSDCGGWGGSTSMSSPTLGFPSNLLVITSIAFSFSGILVGLAEPGCVKVGSLSSLTESLRFFSGFILNKPATSFLDASAPLLVVGAFLTEFWLPSDDPPLTFCLLSSGCVLLFRLLPFLASRTTCLSRLVQLTSLSHSEVTPTLVALLAGFLACKLGHPLHQLAVSFFFIMLSSESMVLFLMPRPISTGRGTGFC